MEKYSPIAVGDTLVDGYDNLWYVINYIPDLPSAFTYVAKCIRGSSIGSIKRFSKYGEVQHAPMFQEGKGNLIKEVIDK